MCKFHITVVKNNTNTESITEVFLFILLTLKFLDNVLGAPNYVNKLIFITQDNVNLASATQSY